MHKEPGIVHYCLSVVVIPTSKGVINYCGSHRYKKWHKSKLTVSTKTPFNLRSL